MTQEFLDKAKSYLGEDGKRVGHYFCSGLQDFMPQRGRYDVIWIQWVIGEHATAAFTHNGEAELWRTVVITPVVSPSGHLTDEHLVEFLRRCREALRPNGLIVIKDNVSYEGVVPDEVDSSVCRDLPIVRRLAAEAGLRIVREEQQTNFPKEIYQVHTLALR